jgi:hypothetical protein
MRLPAIPMNVVSSIAAARPSMMVMAEKVVQGTPRI